MINLIPKEEKKKIIKGIFYKLVVLFLVMGTFFFFIAFATTLPSYFLSSAKNSIADAKLEMQKKEPSPSFNQETLEITKNLNNKLALVEKAESEKFIVSEKVISAIIFKKMPSIEITSISYKNEVIKSASGGKTGKKISIEGSALSREVLLLFRQALEGSIAFKEVDLPISNFVKGSDIKFYLSLIPE